MKFIYSLITSLFFMHVTGVAGVVVTKNYTSEVGTLTESGDKLQLSMKDGMVDFHKCEILWHNTDQAITSYFIAGKKAEAQGQRAPILMSLWQKSIDLEPGTRSEAQLRLQKIKSALAKKLEEEAVSRTAVAEAEAPVFSQLSSKRVISNIHYQQTDFLGFVNYQSSAVISSGGVTKQYNFNIPQPIFSNTSVDTTVISYGSGH
jgi:hypothetical protein